jgi:uncharacterized alkaline shock family protein YloU
VSESVPGKVTIAPEVLVTIVRLTTQEVPGVHAMSAAWTRDVQIQVKDEWVSVDLYIVVEHDVDMLQLGRRIQAEVTRAIEEMVGMEVKEVSVHIEDVYYPPAES